MSRTKPVFDCRQQLEEGWAPPAFYALDTQDEKEKHKQCFMKYKICEKTRAPGK